jgi:Myb-like DNA-binding domain
MPKTVTRRETKRPGPYNLRTSAATTISASNMAAALASPVTPWTPHSHQHMWPDTQLDYSQQHFNIPQTYAMPVQPPAPQPQHHHMPHHSGGAGHPGPSAPWTPDEDNRLMDAKVEGLGWNEIHQRYFPNKSGNACRKRHERLMTKMRTTTWDLGRIQAVMAAYESAGVRAQFWSKIAQQVGETRWEDVERVVRQRAAAKYVILTRRSASNKA